ncbi:MAG: hypothetical protein PHD58_05400 [Anaerolineales bacterium]|nr:hypothetical protein [Anaerolineales bacterium]
MSAIEIGRLLRANTREFVVGCRVSQLNAPAFGALVRIPLEGEYQVYGLIYDIHVDDDGLVRQLVTAEAVDANVIADNRVNRNVPIEMSVLSVGYRAGTQIVHLLPPKPPLSLDLIYLCEADEIRRFTSAGRFGYLRHILGAENLAVGELLAAHLQQAGQAHAEGGHAGWVNTATQELIVLLRDDYPTLMSVLGAIADSQPAAAQESPPEPARRSGDER